MSTRVLMVYPQMPTTYWGYSHALPFIRRKASMPPLGLMTVAAMLPDRYDVRLVDMNVEELLEADVESADLVFVSAMIIQKESFEDVVSRCNQVGTPVVAGGPYPISSYGDISGVDTFVLDEAELTLSRYLRDWEAGHPDHVYRDSGRADITLTPAPRYDLIDVSLYDSMALQYSRGCPYRCEFCDIIEMFGRVPRTKNPEQFLAEMDVVYETGARGSLFIVDDNFVGNRRLVKVLLRRIVEWQTAHGYPFALFTEASVDLAQDEELLDLMEQAAFVMVFVGIETPDADTLTSAGKTQNVKTPLLTSVETIQRHGMEVTGGFILGFDTDPADIFERQIEFIRQACIPIAMVGLLSAIPGTQMFRRLADEGRLLADPTGNNTHDLSLNFVPRMAPRTLVDGYKEVLAQIYAPRNYFLRCAGLIGRMTDRPIVARPITWRDLRALGLSLIKQGISRYGLRYFGFLLNTAIHKPRRFPDAVALAVKGYHFFVMTKQLLRAEKEAESFAAVIQRTSSLLEQRVARVLGDGSARMAETLSRSIVRVRLRLLRQYQKLDTRDSLDRSLTEFGLRCRAWLADLRVVS